MPRKRTADSTPAISDVIVDLDDATARALLTSAALAHDDVERAVRVAAAPVADRVAIFKAEVDRSLRTRKFLDYWGSSHFAKEIDPVVSMLESAVHEEPSLELLKVIERGIDHLVKVLLRADDSNGSIGSQTQRLLSAHCVAAAAGIGEPKALVKWMIERSFDESGFFFVDPVGYANALGADGVAAYRAEIDARGTQPESASLARHAQARLAVLDKDVAAVVASIVGDDAGNAMRIRSLVDALREMGCDDDALEWCRRGFAVAKPWVSGPLYDNAAGILTGRGDLEGALEVRRQQHRAAPSSSTYAYLKRAAVIAKRWHSEQAEAREVLAKADRGGYVDALLLSDDAVDEAWTAAFEGPVWAPGADRLVRLAQARASTDPSAATGAYLQAVDAVLVDADARNYAAAVKYLTAAAKTAQAGAVYGQFSADVARLREEHKRRPSLIARLDKAGFV